MATTHHIKAGYNGKSAQIEMRLPVIVFQERDCFIAYIPVLDLSGYGKTEEEAKYSLGVVLEDYLDYSVKNHTLHQDLIKHGFKLNREHASIEPPEPAELFKGNSVLNKLVKSKPFNKTDLSVQIPAYC
jgi:hypothetical protein